MIFVDTCFFLSLLNHNDQNHDQAVKLSTQYGVEKLLTTYAVVSEIATVGSQRISKELTVKFLNQLLHDHRIQIVMESTELMTATWHIFKSIKGKNISWVDCYSIAVMKRYHINDVLTFDRDFKRIQRQLVSDIG